MAKPGPKQRKVMVDRTESWDGLEAAMPEEYKILVRGFMHEAAERINSMIDEDSTMNLRPAVVTEARIRLNQGPNSKRNIDKRRRVTSARRMVILTMLSYGKSGEEIAEVLGISRHNLHNYIYAIKKTYKCRTTVELVAKAIRSGFID